MNPLSSVIEPIGASALTVITTTTTSEMSRTSSVSTVPSITKLTNETTSCDRILSIMKSISNEISFKGMKTLIELERSFPLIGWDAKSSERLDYFTRVLNSACNSSFSKATVLAAHNALVIDNDVRNELLRPITIEKLVTQYEATNSTSLNHNKRNILNIMPFTSSCPEADCQDKVLCFNVSANGYVAFSSSMKSCSVYHGVCSNCQRIYGPTSIVDRRENRRIVTVESISHNDYVYFSGDLVFSRELLIMFSNNLIHAHTTFEGFAESYVATIVELNKNQQPIYSANAFAKRLQTVWIYYETSRLIFMTSCETSFLFPRSFRPETKSIFIEQNLSFFLHIFTVFWSRHNQLAGIKCKNATCSRIMLIDGHQKSRRLVCSFENLTDTNHSEMGPVLQGCPYAPTRRKRAHDQRGRVMNIGLRFFNESDIFFSRTNSTVLFLSRNVYVKHRRQSKICYNRA